MKYLLFLYLTLIAPRLWAQQSESRSIGSFTGVRAASGVEVFLEKGDKEMVRIQLAEGDPSEVRTEVSGGYLRIYIDSHWGKMSGVKVYVTYTRLDAIFASAAAKIQHNGVLKVRELTIGAASAADIELAIDVDELEVNASSAADVTLSGKAKTAELEAGSAGEIKALDLEVETTTISCSSAALVQVTVTKSIEARANSGGSIRYRGNPPRAITHSGSAGSVRRTE